MAAPSPSVWYGGGANQRIHRFSIPPDAGRRVALARTLWASIAAGGRAGGRFAGRPPLVSSPLRRPAEPPLDGHEVREGLRMRLRMRIRLPWVSGARLVHILIPTLALLSLVATPGAAQSAKVFRVGILSNVPLSSPQGAPVWGAFV